MPIDFKYFFGIMFIKDTFYEILGQKFWTFFYYFIFKSHVKFQKIITHDQFLIFFYDFQHRTMPCTHEKIMAKFFGPK